jgi:uncharacterized protein (TIGR00255 family)
MKQAVKMVWSCDMMIRSMTGFGQAERSLTGLTLRVDMKSVNHRYLEIAIRMPREWLHLEDSLKKRIQQRVKRGRVDVFVAAERESSAGAAVEIDWARVDGYIEAAAQIAARTGLAGLESVDDLLRLPDLIRIKEPEADGEAWANELAACADEALDRLVRMREAEGVQLQADLNGRIRTVERLCREAADRYPQALEHNRTKLKSRIMELLEDAGSFDEQRFAMEAAVLAERSAIDEELTRLQSHLIQFQTAMQADEPVGRKLDFLLQEMNREANTIAAKCSDARLAQIVVELKSELEKIREQAQNVE